MIYYECELRDRKDLPPLNGNIQKGLFALEDIPRGSCFWKYDPKETSDEHLALVDKVNHERHANLSIEFKAVRDIQKGDEITINYREHGLPVDF